MSSLSPRSFLVTETIDLLLYISKTQSFTETSRLMGLSQSMVSRKLSAFEATTGITAVDRSSRPVKGSDAVHRRIAGCIRQTSNRQQY